MCDSESYCRISRRKFHPSLSESSSHRKSRLAVWNCCCCFNVSTCFHIFCFFVSYFSSRFFRLSGISLPKQITHSDWSDKQPRLVVIVVVACFLCVCLLCASNVYTVQKGCQSNALQSHWDSDDSPSIQKAKQSKRPGYGIILSRKGAIYLAISQLMAIQHRHSQNRNVCVYITKVTRCRRSFFSSSSSQRSLSSRTARLDLYFPFYFLDFSFSLADAF